MKDKGLKGVTGIVSWNGYYYGRKGNKFYKSKTARFDDSFGGTQEVGEEEYFKNAEKYASVFR